MYPLIILGAGASRDYVDPAKSNINNDYRMPLTNDIFNQQIQIYNNILTEHQEVTPLASEVVNIVPHKMTLERYLLKVKNEYTSKDKNSQKQLISLEFYLQKLFKNLSTKYGSQHINNYKALINRINIKAKNACIVSYNYDTLLEQNLTEVIGELLDTYVSGDIKLIKLHGSCDWVYPFSPTFLNGGNSYNHLMEDPWYLNRTDNLQNNYDPIRRIKGDLYYENDGNKESHYVPAIAIPLAKKASQICPDVHIKALENALSEIDRILIIGWRAGDQYLLSLMKKLIKQPVKVMIVSRNNQSGKETKKKLVRIKSLNITVSDNEGFNEFIKGDQYDEFFN